MVRVVPPGTQPASSGHRLMTSAFYGKGGNPYRPKINNKNKNSVFFNESNLIYLTDQNSENDFECVIPVRKSHRLETVSTKKHRNVQNAKKTIINGDVKKLHRARLVTVNTRSIKNSSDIINQIAIEDNIRFLTHTKTWLRKQTCLMLSTFAQTVIHVSGTIGKEKWRRCRSCV